MWVLTSQSVNQTDLPHLFTFWPCVTHTLIIPITKTDLESIFLAYEHEFTVKATRVGLP